MKKDSLQLLEKIEAAEVSPFLFARIQAKVQEQIFDKLSTKQTVIYLAGIAMIIALNVMVLGAKDGSEPEKKPDLVSGMDLAPSNQLYP